uniref:Uncharacterized protein n=1 Tax=Lates calcarifer TaxID=8187 RepID=A0A4W6ENS7_LATCA
MMKLRQTQRCGFTRAFYCSKENKEPKGLGKNTKRPPKERWRGPGNSAGRRQTREAGRTGWSSRARTTRQGPGEQEERHRRDHVSDLEHRESTQERQGEETARDAREAQRCGNTLGTRNGGEAGEEDTPQTTFSTIITNSKHSDLL